MTMTPEERAKKAIDAYVGKQYVPLPQAIADAIREAERDAVAALAKQEPVSATCFHQISEGTHDDEGYLLPAGRYALYPASMKLFAAPPAVALDTYDAGLLGDGGGGDVAWWHDYIRSELERAHEFYQEQVDQFASPAVPDGLAEYIESRRRTIEASIAAEAFAGNSVKEQAERTALAELDALHQWARENQKTAPAVPDVFDHCQVVFYPPDGSYPLEHNLRARKDMRNEIERAMLAAAQEREGKPVQRSAEKPVCTCCREQIDGHVYHDEDGDEVCYSCKWDDGVGFDRDMYHNKG